MTAMICPTTSLWMGDVAPEMDENFIIGAFAQAGETIVRVKIMNGRQTNAGYSAKYCFVEFIDYESAQRALHTLNGAYIPGTPGQRFKLNTASRDQSSSTDYSIYVGNLAGNIDDMALCTFFQQRYPSVHGAKVILDQSGKSRCFGFVRFSNEGEQHRALKEMQNSLGLGSRPLKVSTATSKKPDINFYQTYQEPQAVADYNNPYHQQYNSLGPYLTQQESEVENTSEAEEDAETLEDPGLEINISKENREFIDSSESFFTALELSRWQPLDNIMSEIPDE